MGPFLDSAIRLDSVLSWSFHDFFFHSESFHFCRGFAVLRGEAWQEWWKKCCPATCHFLSLRVASVESERSIAADCTTPKLYVYQRSVTENQSAFVLKGAFLPMLSVLWQGALHVLEPERVASWSSGGRRLAVRRCCMDTFGLLAAAWRGGRSGVAGSAGWRQSACAPAGCASEAMRLHNFCYAGGCGVSGCDIGDGLSSFVLT